MKRTIALAVFTAASLLFAHDEPKGKPITMTARVVDTGCYFSQDAPQKGHLACAKMCAKNGIPLALVDDAGALYMVIAAEHQNPNTQLMPFIEKKVKVTGILVEKGGMHAVSIKTVAAAE
ncbi:MAG TPA: hypothetical protein VKS01_11570 [Bryobacteraceae bacterium]|nr:hypothetical protein [Bryobacteraceae bacterium]